MPPAADANEARTLLTNLAGKIHQVVESARAAASLRLTSKQRWIHPDPTLYCRARPELSQCRPRAVMDQELIQACAQKLFDEGIASTDEYGNASRMVEGLAYGPEILFDFVTRVLRGYAEKGVAFKAEEHVTAAVAYFFKTPIPSEARLWLDAITADETVVAGDLKFRPPTCADFEQRTTNQGAAAYQHSHVSCMADWHLRDQRNGGQVGPDRMVTALRLFRLGSVQAPRFEGLSLAFKSFNIYGGGRSLPVNFSYALRSDDGPELRTFLETIPPLLPSKYQDPPPATDFFTTALNWYEQAMFSQGPPEAGVAWAVACLEALYLGDNPNTELNYRLGLRVATLLRCFGFPPLAVKAGVKQVYEIRSKYVHGALMPRKLDAATKTSLFRMAATYARVSLLAWRTLTRHDSRTDLLTLIENAILDSDHQEKLKTKCDAVALPSMRFETSTGPQALEKAP